MQTLSRRGRVSDGGQMTFPFLKVTKFPNDVLFFHRISLHRCNCCSLEQYLMCLGTQASITINIFTEGWLELI